MAWISLVVVMLVLYAPFIDLGHRMPLADTSLLLASLGIWLALWLLLLAVEWALGIDLPARLRLRNRFLYAQRPYVSNSLAVGLASLVLIGAAIHLVLWLLTGQVAWLFALDSHLAIASALTLVAAAAFGLEASYRYHADIRRNQHQRKERQTSIQRPGAYA